MILDKKFTKKERHMKNKSIIDIMKKLRAKKPKAGHMSVIPVLYRLRQANHEFKVSLSQKQNQPIITVTYYTHFEYHLHKHIMLTETICLNKILM